MDRRFIWAMALMTLVVMAPALLKKKPPVTVSAPADPVTTVTPHIRFRSGPAGAGASAVAGGRERFH